MSASEQTRLRRRGDAAADAPRQAGLAADRGAAQRLPQGARGARPRRRREHPLPRARRAGRRHAGPAAPRPRELRHLRQHLPRLQRLPDEPHHQPHPRHRRDPDASPCSASATWAARSSPTAGFEERGFHIAVAFDVDSEKVGPRVRRPALLPRRPPGDGAARVRRPHGDPRVPARGAAGAGRPRRAAPACTRSSTSCPSASSVPGGCFVEETDIASKLEMLSFLARSEAEAQASSAAPGEPAAEGMTA